MDVPKTRKRVNAKNARILSTPAWHDSEAKYQKLIEHYANNGKLLRACEAAGIDHSSHWRRMRNDPVYRAAIEEAGQQSAQEVEDTVFGLALEGEQWAAMAILRRFRPEQYRAEHAAVEVTIDLGQRIQEGHQRVIEMRKAENDVNRAG